MESPRQKKIAALLQQEIAQLLQGAVRKEGVHNLLISVTKVNVTIDLSVAKVYLSLFPSEKANEWLEGIHSNTFQVKHDLAQLLKNDLRRIPELIFFLDDSLDYIEKIDRALHSPENPISDRSQLTQRKKK
jgi:ribosome-binding factor A